MLALARSLGTTWARAIPAGNLRWVRAWEWGLIGVLIWLFQQA